MPHEIAELFRRSELFYVYENTALAIEAVLCGCPAVFLPNPHLTEIIAAKELGAQGYAWGPDPVEVARAKATVGQGKKNYEACYARYWQDLDRFIALTEEHAQNKAYKSPIHLPSTPDVIRLITHERGLWGFAKSAVRKLYKLAMPIRHSRTLILDTHRAAGVRGVIKRVIQGLRQYGPVGFVRLLRGVMPSQES